MATGIIATMGASATVTYTPSKDAKIMISVFGDGGSGGLSINSKTICAVGTGVTLNGITHYVGAGSTVTFVTSATTTAVISALEEN